MSTTAPNAGLFFQTSSSLAASERKSRKAANAYGAPVRFASKILALCSATHDGEGERSGSGSEVYVAEAAGVVGRLDLEDAARWLGKWKRSRWCEVLICYARWLTTSDH
ncbi:hypothetical protein MRB53_040730 [Persea americana]|nr:hypothetical protein MRB53_040730 [Persea americana]